MSKKIGMMNRSRAARKRTRLTDKPWLSTRPSGHTDTAETPEYITEKQKAIEFWKRGVRGLPPYVIGVCCVCGAWLTRAQPPITHHGIIPRNRGVTIHCWWGLFPVCSEHCHTKLHTHDGMAAVLGKLYVRISRDVLADDPPSPVRGHAWVQAQIDQLVAEGKLDDRQKLVAEVGT